MRRIPRPGMQAALVAATLGVLVIAPGPQAARLVDANLVVSVAGPASPPTAGQTISFAATVANRGPDRATSVGVTLTVSGARATISSAAAPGPDSVCAIKNGAQSAHCAVGAIEVGGSTQMTIAVTPGASGAVTVTASSRARQYDPVPADSRAQVRTSVTETAAPVPDAIFSPDFARTFSPHRTISLRWRAVDDGSGVATYDVRYRTATVTSGFGPYQDWLKATNLKVAKFVGVYGATYCFSFRATDYDGNTSPWTADRCASIQLPATGMRHSSAWTRSGLDGALRARATGANLSLVRLVARRLILSADVGPGYGQVRATWNGQVLRVINLAAAARAKRLFTLGEFPSAKRGTLALTIVSTKKAVPIRALGVLKS